jgi:hypothetical protein
LRAVILGAVAVLFGTTPCCAQAVPELEGPRLTYHIAEADPSAGSRATDVELAEWALQAWADLTAPALALAATSADEASVRIHWVRADEGLYGEARVRDVGERRVADVYIRPDLRGLGADIEAEAVRDPLFRDVIVYLTCVHELGHALGLAHTDAFADIMYSFQYGGDFVGYFRRFRDRLETRAEMGGTSPFSAADREALRAARGLGPR